MRFRAPSPWFAVFLAGGFVSLHALDALGCTTGTAMGAATVDGRPIAWHNEDLTSHHAPLIRKLTNGTYDNIVIQADNGWGQGGINELGLARFINNQSALGTYSDILAYISRTFASIEEVRTYLDTQSYDAAYSTPVIDATGRAVMLEIGDDEYWEYDPESSGRQQQSCFESPKLFAVRSNRAFTNSDQQEPVDVPDSWGASSRLRYQRAKELFSEKITDAETLTLEDIMAVSRDGNPDLEPYAICRTYTVWGVIAAGVDAGEDPRFATLLVAMGNPDYSIFIPVWVDLAQDELCEKATTWDDTWTTANADNIGWWSFKLLEDRFDGTEDYDEYINALFAPVESNIIEGVKTARARWLDHGRTERFHEEARVLHVWSGWAAFDTIKSAHQTSTSGSPRSCNRPPHISQITGSADGLTVNLDCPVTDADGDQILEYFWNFGDGQGSGSTQESSLTHTYDQAGSYMVTCFARDARGAANVRFEWVTAGGGSCIPSCVNRECGSDGCGGTCGTCATPLVCDTGGQCTCASGQTDCGADCVDTQTDPQHCGTCNHACSDGVACEAGHCLDLPALPSPWQSQDVGSVGLTGAAGASGDVFEVHGSGADIWGSSGAFHFVHQTLEGDGEISARVVSQENTHQWAKAGVMIRETIDAGSKQAMTVVMPAPGVRFQHRAQTSGSMESAGTSMQTPPHWVRVTRAGDLFTGYESTDGETWTAIGSATISMAASALVGLVVLSHDNTTLATVFFDDVVVSGSCTPDCTDRECGSDGCGGSCGSCDDAFVCDAQGACLCATGREECAGTCVDLQSDPLHCGACGHECDPGDVCSVAACETECASGMSDCGGACVDLQTDVAHCGSCDHACAGNEICENAACVLTCADGDGDGYLDAVCGGDDCNDDNAETSPGALEICDDEIDNDCDGDIDAEDDDCLGVAISGGCNAGGSSLFASMISLVFAATMRRRRQSHDARRPPSATIS